MSIQTTHQFNHIPAELIEKTALYLPLNDWGALRATSTSINQIIKKLCEKYICIPHVFAFNSDCSEAAVAVSNAILDNVKFQDELYLTLKKNKQWNNKLLGFLSDLHAGIPKLQGNRSNVHIDEVEFEKSRDCISLATQEFEKAVKNRLSEIQLSPSHEMTPQSQIKLEQGFVFFYRWFHMLTDTENNPAPIKAMIETAIKKAYSDIKASMPSWMIDQFVNSTQPLTKKRYKLMIQSLGGNKKLQAELNQKLLEKFGGFENFDFQKFSH